MIVIPMAGLSRRFTEAGYELPKFMLKAHGKSLFSWSVESFKKYFDSEFFLFITLKKSKCEDFIKSEILKLGIKNYYIATIDSSEGQADTVYQGLKNLFASHSPANDKDHLLIFNIDTFRLDFVIPSAVNDWDGYLEVFEGSGNNWSYVKASGAESTKIIEVAEKNPISNLCCTGLYHFKNTSDFIKIFEMELNKPLGSLQGGERYIAPLYNYLINKSKNIHYNLIDRSQVIFCGVPTEYENFLKMKII